MEAYCDRHSNPATSRRIPAPMTASNSPSDASKDAVAESDAVMIYRAVLARNPSPNEIARFHASRSAGGTLDHLIKALCRSKEATQRQMPLFVPPGHFYSPIVDTASIRDKIPITRSPSLRHLPGIDIDLAEMERLWSHTLGPLARTTAFSEHPTDGARFHYANPAFGFGDAAILRAMILALRPKRIVEVGSGYSSACMLDALDEGRIQSDVLLIEPYPQLVKSLLRKTDLARVRIEETQVQDVALPLFESLTGGDFLFIDSTHVAKTGSDVVYELNEILPRLAPGVFIHFHDIFYPFEYNYQWAITENRSWNEIYMLRSFLSFNNKFKIVFFNDMMAQLRKDELLSCCPDFFCNTGGSFWLKRVEK